MEEKPVLYMTRRLDVTHIAIKVQQNIPNGY